MSCEVKDRTSLLREFLQWELAAGLDRPIHALHQTIARYKGNKDFFLEEKWKRQKMSQAAETLASQITGDKCKGSPLAIAIGSVNNEISLEHA